MWPVWPSTTPKRPDRPEPAAKNGTFSGTSGPEKQEKIGSPEGPGAAALRSPGRARSEETSLRAVCFLSSSGGRKKAVFLCEQGFIFCIDLCILYIMDKMSVKK